MANNTCFFLGEKLLLGDVVLFWVQPPGAGEHGGGATCVDVVDHSVERLGLRGVGPQQGREFLEQLLYQGREGGDGGDSL